ncbi:hypothetical protein Erwinia_phage_Tian_00068 [Erwinia phage Tian]|uniref:Uncharacterized protein n=2 Tax=Kolesnikvirus TaxID=1985293 RepID=A0A346FHX1_9CAUD|nr:hypothetical protein SUNLIREN_101 [Erwinia phage SunLIRen]UXD79879.1 hypothetical protein 4Roscha1_00072 [Erwinia phage Roscha1]WJN64371.1 hypothetical protein Erwinia_phage_Panisse_00018 [Erwinia phage Panisse]WJN64704.1 hypothetical protein Erwinia_phage_Pistou_00067 [Erwinia phage Pistou]WJN64983.1 hypothetical protein Erwinia_phage_Tian_00068 [Erwinia phage Tian]
MLSSILVCLTIAIGIIWLLVDSFKILKFAATRPLRFVSDTVIIFFGIIEGLASGFMVVFLYQLIKAFLK